MLVKQWQPDLYAARLVLVPLLMLGLAPPTWANDARIMDQVHRPGTVHRLEGKPSVQTMIEFPGGERIENIAIGDSTAWQVTPNKRGDLLFVKPLASNAATNMTVVTDQTIYVFDLLAKPNARPVYAYRIATAGNGRGTPTDAQQTPIRQPFAEDGEQRNPYAIVDPTTLSFDWLQSGDTAVLPRLVYDDGCRTFLQWAADQEVPALFTIEEEKEVPLGFAARGQMIVINQVPSVIVLRSVAGAATLTNRP